MSLKTSVLVGVAHPRGADGVIDEHQAPAQVGLQILAVGRPSAWLELLQDRLLER